MRAPQIRLRIDWFIGALAQLGERNTGSVEVSGSIPLGSTKSPFQKMPQALLTLGDEEYYTSRDV